MNNKTILEVKIKQRGDGVYDLYINEEWIVSRGHYENILEEVKKEIKRIDCEQIVNNNNNALTNENNDL